MTTLRWFLTIIVAAVSGGLFYFVFAIERADGAIGSPMMILMGVGIFSAVASLITYHGLWGLAVFWGLVSILVPATFVFAIPTLLVCVGLAFWHLKSHKPVIKPEEEF